MKEFNEEYLDNIRKIIAEHDDAKARELLDELHPADIAELYNCLLYTSPSPRDRG